MTRAVMKTQRQGSTPPGKAWPAERLAEARAVIADVAHHSDHLIRLACRVLARHGESDAERREAQVLLLIVDARTPQSHGRHQRPDADDDPEVTS